MIAAFLFLASACTKKDELTTKKEELAKYKDEVRELKGKISELENFIAEHDTTVSETARRNAVLVNLKKADKGEFIHQIEVQGQVQSRTNVNLASETGGMITAVPVKEGDKVSKGQLLVGVDSEVLQNNIKELKTSLELATAVYERQSNLWKKKIGTEIQYLEAKNNKESIESRLATAYSQLDKTRIKAPFTGTVDKVDARVGEMASPGMPLVRMVNLDKMYLNADVSERYIGEFKAGDPVEIYFPVQDKRIESTIKAASDVINNENRTFNVEINMPKSDFIVKPNQVVVIRLTDYKKEDAITVPTEIILTDANGKYLYVAEEKDGHLEAKKVAVKAGKSQDGATEILDGVSTNDKLVIDGFRDLNEGTLITPTDNSTETAKLN